MTGRPDRPRPPLEGIAHTKLRQFAVEAAAAEVGACRATAANVNDTVLFERLFLAAFAVMARIKAVFTDRGYDAETSRDLCRRFRAKPHIHKRRQPHGSGLGKQR